MLRRFAIHWAPALLLVLLLTGAASATPVEWATKVDPWVLDRLAGEGEAEMLVVLVEQADLGAAARLGSNEAKGRFVYERLTEVATRSQRPVLRQLEALGLEHRAYWIVNMIWVRGDEEAVVALASRSDVQRIHANPSVRLATPSAAPARAPQGIEQSIDHVGAPDLWAAGFTGQGTVIAGADTGYAWQHPALQGKYRGWDGANADHDYNWHDAIHSGGGSCGADSSEPCDDLGHGTHTMGTMVGDDGAGNQIGMAPGARWIGCRNMDQGNGTPTTYSECFQFFLAPTDLAGENPRPDLAPDVVNGSWSCPVSEGCTDPNVLLSVVQNVRAAGIVVVQSAGNDGPSCSSVDTPAAIYAPTFTVGAVDNNDMIVGFSSRGPVTIDGSDRLKPDVTAPGMGIRSSLPPSGYGQLSGTSMSAPHVAGLVALVVSAQPCLRGFPHAIERHILETVVPRTTTEDCGGVDGDEVPNNTYGHGAIRAVVPTTCPQIFEDGFESGDTSAWSAVVP